MPWGHGLGNVPDKIIKKQRKTFGTLRDIVQVKSVGIIEDPAKGLVKYAKPVGVVGAIRPRPIREHARQHGDDGGKGRNAIILAASPAGLRTTERTVERCGPAEAYRRAGGSGAAHSAGVEGARSFAPCE